MFTFVDSKTNYNECFLDANLTSATVLFVLFAKCRFCALTKASSLRLCALINHNSYVTYAICYLERFRILLILFLCADNINVENIYMYILLLYILYMCKRIWSEYYNGNYVYTRTILLIHLRLK